MEKGSISIDALISMVLIISLIMWLQSIVSAQQDYVNIYGGELQSDYLSLQYGSMINNYYVIKADTGLIVNGPVIKLFARELRQTPEITISNNKLTIIAYDDPTYPIPSSISRSDIIAVRK